MSLQYTSRAAQLYKAQLEKEAAKLAAGSLVPASSGGAEAVVAAPAAAAPAPVAAAPVPVVPAPVVPRQGENSLAHCATHPAQLARVAVTDGLHAVQATLRRQPLAAPFVRRHHRSDGAPAREYRVGRCPQARWQQAGPGREEAGGKGGRGAV
jgi:hypothetical protein